MSRSSRRSDVVVALVLAWAAVAPSAFAAEETVVFVRMESLLETVGVTEVRVAYGARIDVPLASCDAPRADPSCREGRRFEQLIGITFAEESRERRGDDVDTGSEPRGEAVIAVDLDAEGERRLLEAIDRRLRELSPVAFRESFAGTGLPGAPVADDLILPAPGRAFICSRDGAVATLSTRSRTEFGGARSDTTREDLVDPTCAQMFEAVSTVAPRRSRTMTSPLIIGVEEVRLGTRDDLPDTVWPEEFPALPDRTWLESGDAEPGVVSGSGQSVTEDGEVTSYSIGDGVRTDARVRPTHLPARTVDHGLLSQRWIVERRVETLGPYPTLDDVEQDELVVGWIPVPASIGAQETDVPGSEAEAPSEPVPVRMREEFFHAVRVRLGRRSAWTVDALDRIVTGEPYGLDSPGWMYVVCRPDGTAFWGLAPTGARAPVLDPDPICDEISARVP